VLREATVQFVASIAATAGALGRRVGSMTALPGQLDISGVRENP
jgi:hypothetical protein